MKEVLEAFTNRLKSPVFGYFILALIALNWKVIFYLFASDTSVTDRFNYFDINTNTQSLLVKPVIISIIGAILYPWINLLFIWIIKMPIEYRQIIHISSKNKILIKEQEFEEVRAKLLATKEKELISRAKRDKEIKSFQDDDLRDELQKQIEDLRNQVDDKEQNVNASKSTTGPDLVEIYMELAKLNEKKGNIERAEQYMQEAVQHRQYNP